MKINVVFTILITAIITIFYSTESPCQTQIQQKCINEADQNIGFYPKAITLTSLNVRSYYPEYSLLKGKWIFGRIIDILKPDTCISILDKRMVGVVQIWYLIEYRDNNSNSIKSGWVWGGTKDVDDNRYIGGDKSVPSVKKQSQNTNSMINDKANFFNFISETYAAADYIPSDVSNQLNDELPSRNEGSADYYINVIGLTLKYSTLSTILLYLAMVIGMIAKAMWDQTEEGNRIIPPTATFLKPILISPITFSAFWGPLYVQQGNVDISLTSALYAFQIGFMWQHVLERKFGGTPKIKTNPT